MKAAKLQSNYFVTKLFWKIFIAQALLESISVLNFLVDNLVTSWYLGADAVAAIALYSPISCIVMGISIAISVGGTVVIVRQLGKAEKDKANNTFTVVMLAMIAIGLVFTLLMVFDAKNIAGWLGDQSDAGYLADYIVGMGILQIACYLGSFFLNSLQLIGHEKRIIVSILVMVVTNIIGDVFFVVVLRMGAFGLGLATSISCLFQFLVLLPPFMKKDCVLKPRLHNLEFTILGKVLIESVPLGLFEFSTAIKTYALNGALSAAGGTMAVAAGTIQNITCWLTSAVILGGAKALVFLMSLYVTEEDKVSAINTFRISARNVAVVITAITALLIAFAEQIAGAFYEAGSEPYLYAVSGIRIFIYFVYPSILLKLVTYSHQALERTRISTVSSVAENLAIAGCAVILQPLMGINGVWLGIPVGTLVTLLIILAYAWVKRKKISFRPEDMILLSEKISIEQKYRMERTLYSVQDAVGISVEIGEFCKNLGLDKKTQMVAGMSIEELSVLMFQYSLSGVKNAQAEVRVLLKDDGLLIRFRDNGRELFKGNEIDFSDPNDPTANIGLQMLLSMNVDITANSIMGLNVVTAKLPVHSISA